jgi:hypothetical protein
MAKWKEEKRKLVLEANQDHFSNDVDLATRALNAEKKLLKLREKMMEEDNVCMTGDYCKKLPFLLNSPLYECLDKMPKPAVHHIHLTAAAKAD